VNRKRVLRLYLLGAESEAYGIAPWTCHGPCRADRALEYEFLHDGLAAGRPFRILTVADNWSRCSPVLAAGFRITEKMVSQVLDRILGQGRGSRSITVDHGTEFQSRALEDWSYRRGVQLDFIRSGKPVENALVESSNGRRLDECLNVHQFASLEDLRGIIWSLADA